MGQDIERDTDVRIVDLIGDPKEFSLDFVCLGSGDQVVWVHRFPALGTTGCRHFPGYGNRSRDMGDRPFSLVALVVSFPNTIGVKVCGCQEGDEGFDGVPACFALSRGSGRTAADGML